jgi:hypothetical protein
MSTGGGKVRLYRVPLRINHDGQRDVSPLREYSRSRISSRRNRSPQDLSITVDAHRSVTGDAHRSRTAAR